MAHPERHTHIIEDAKTQHAERVLPAGEEFKKTMGNQIGNHIADQNHDRIADKLQGHPLAGPIGKSHLRQIVKRLAPLVVNADSNPSAFRGAVDYLHGALKGSSRLDNMMESLVGERGERLPMDKAGRQALKEKLTELRDHPEQMMELGGDLGHYLPDHHAALTGSFANAVDYLNQLEPVHAQKTPLDEPAPADPLAQAKQDRAIDIAHQPLMALQRVKDGTIIPQDVSALQTMYPKLYQVMSQKMMDRIITARAKDERIPYRQKQSMSLFLGQPLDFTQTPEAAQAILKSAATQQMNRTPQPKKPSAQALTQISKTDELYALPTERRQIDRKS